MSDLAIRERVAREVFEFSRIGRLYASYGYSARDKLLSVDELPAYESDIAAAWLVVEEMRKRGWHGFDLFYEGAGGDNEWGVEFWQREVNVTQPVLRHASTPPLAICLAALAAVEAR